MLHDISITIIDTYINTSILVDELAQADACKLEWNGGDDVYKNIMSSKLMFNMLVSDASDAHFISLFTGDEKRFRVEVNGIDVDDNYQLLWQGFLLPDQYSEPYKNGVFFVDFVATDMLSVIKGNVLDSWIYESRYPIAQLLAIILKTTGLNQNIIVKPSIIPDSNILDWDAINVNLRQYSDGKTFKDLNHILEAILKAQALTLYSYKGFWWLEGVTRKHELNSVALQFDANGNRIDNMNLTKSVFQPLFSANQPTFTAVSPWKKVNISFDANGTSSLFSETVIKIEKNNVYSTAYSTGGYTGPSYPNTEIYQNVRFKDWNVFTNSDFIYLGKQSTQLRYKINRMYAVGSSTFINYNYNEAAVLSNYFECGEKPYVKPGILYEIEAEFKVEIKGIISDSVFKKNVKNGYYDRFFPFQIFVNNVEKFSNRPGFNSDANTRYQVLDQSPEESGEGSSTSYAMREMVFKLKFTFNVEVAGQLSFRLLMPIINNPVFNFDSPDNWNVGTAFFYGERLTLKATEGYNENETVKAVRGINYTSALDYDIDISSSIDASIVNSFGIGYPINSNYNLLIDRTDTPGTTSGWHYFSPATALELKLATWKSNAAIVKLLFADNLKKNVYLQKVSGEKILFSSLWNYFNNPTNKIAYLTSYSGFPVIPKDYVAYSGVVPADLLYIFYIAYASENLENREYWKIYGLPEVSRYVNTLAKALHVVQPKMIFRLDATALKIIFPDDIIKFRYNAEDLQFIPSTINIDLFNGKTNIVATQSEFENLTDIVYE